MILSDLLGSAVHADGFLGYVTDVRFALDPTSTDQPTPAARLFGLVVSPHARSSSLGFERRDVRSPWLIAALVRRRHRGSFLVAWDDIALIGDRRVELRPGYRRHSSALSQPAVIRPELG